MRILSLIFTTAIALSSQAYAWGGHDHRTYRGPSQSPVVIHPMRPTYPVYQPAPIYRTAPVYRSHPYYRPAPVFRASPTYWRNGYWSHTWHDNRFGWWWVTGNAWSFYSAPTYPYPEYEPQPAPQVTVIQPSAPPVAQTAPAEPRPSGNNAPPSNTGMYYFCDASQLYYPYAKTCSERWRAVSSISAD